MDLSDIAVTTLRGEQTTFGALTGGKAALVVNVASRCGLAPQYEQLEELQKTYGERGFTVIGFPSNQFLQELHENGTLDRLISRYFGHDDYLEYVGTRTFLDHLDERLPRYTELFKQAAGVDIVHVPYQPAAAINAVVAGHTQIASTSMPPAVPMIKSGRLKALAVTSATRSPLLPDVPSITEFGYKEFDDYTWFGFMAPVGTPAAIVEKLNAAINWLDAPNICQR